MGVEHFSGARFAGLAVALGIGTAVATGQGVANADPTDPGTDSSASQPSVSQPSASQPSASQPSADSAGPAEPSTSGTPQAHTPGVKRGPLRAPRMQLPEKDTRQVTGNEKDADEDPVPADHSSEPADQTEHVSSDDVPPTPAEPTAETPPITSAEHPGDGGAPVTPAPRHQPPTVVRPDTEDKHDGAATHSGQPASAAPEDDSTSAGELRVSAVALRTAVASQPEKPSAAPIAAPVAAAQPVPSVLTRLIQGVLSPFINAAPAGAPAQPPLLWAVLAFVRREIENLLFTRPPSVAPTLTSQSDTGSIEVDLNATSAYGDPVSVKVVSPPKNGQLTLNADGTYTYAPDTAFAHAGGTDQFTVRVIDTQLHPRLLTLFQYDFGRSTLATVKVTVSAVNAAPTLDPVSAADSDGVVTGSVGGRDKDGDPLTYSLTGEPGRGKVTLNSDGSFTYVPDKEFAHAAAQDDAPEEARWDTFTVSVADGRGATTVGDVLVAVTEQNAKPILLPNSAPDPSTGVVTGSVGGYDDDQDDLEYQLVSNGGKGTVTLNPDGTFTYTPDEEHAHAAANTGAPEDAKWDTFTVAVTDGHGATTVGDVLVAVSGQNTKPTLTPDSTADPGTGVVTGTVGGLDFDHDQLAYQLVSNGAKGTVTLNPDGTFTYTPDEEHAHAAANTGAPEDAKWDTFTVAVTDGHGATTVGEVKVAVTPSNADPKLTPRWKVDDPATGKVIGSMAGTDEDNDQLTYSIDRQPTKGTLTLNADGSFTYVPFADAAHAAAADGATTADKRDTFVITVTDGHGGTKSPEWTVPVTAQNQNFTLTQSSSTDTDTGVYTVNLGYHDADGDAFTYAIVDPATKGVVTVDSTGTGKITFRPTTAGALTPGTTDTIVVKITDSHGHAEFVTVNVTVPHQTVTRQAPIALGDYQPSGVVAVSPDGTTAYVPTVHGLYTVNLTTRDVTYVGLTHYSDLNDVAAGPNGTVYLMVTGSNASSQGRAYRVDPATGADIDSNPLGRYGVTIATSADGQYVYALTEGSSSGSVAAARFYILNADDMTTVKSFTNITRTPNAMVVSPDGNTVYLAHPLYRDIRAGVVAVDLTTEAEREIPIYNGVQSMALNADGTQLYVTSLYDEGLLTGYDTATGAQLGQFKIADDAVSSKVALSPDGSVAYVTSQSDRKVYVIDTANMTQLAVVSLNAPPRDIVVAPDGTVYVAFQQSSVLGVITVG